jgi:hypothetical protein
LGLLNSGRPFSRKEGGFLGQMCVVTGPVSVLQLKWLNGLLERSDYPSLS